MNDEEKARQALDQLIKRAKELDSFDDPEIQGTFQLLLCQLPPEEIPAYKKILSENEESSRERVNDLSFLATSSPELSGVDLGNCKYGPVVLAPDILKRNLAIFGETGAGKTVLMERIVRQCLDFDLKVWIFDFEQEFVHLAKEYDLLYLNWHHMKYNPLAPSVGAKSWLGTFIDVFGFSQGLWLASQGFLGTTLYKLYELFGCFSQSCESYPTLHQLHKTVKAVKPRGQPQAQYKSRIESRLSLFTTLYGDLFECASGAQPESLLDKSVIFDFSGMLPFAYAFIADLYLSGLFRLLRDQIDSDLTHVVAASEARHLISARRKERLTDIDPFMDQLMARSRRRGLGVILDDQEPSAITKTARANTHTKVLFHLGEGKDINLMSRSLGLTGPQKRLAYRLRVGEALVAIGNQKPKLVKVPFPGNPPRIPGKERKELAESSMGKLDIKDPYEPKDFGKFLQIAGFEDKLGDKEGSEGISPQQMYFLKDIAKTPFITLSERYENLGLSGRKGGKLKKTLKKRGLIEEAEINMGRGGRPKILGLTEKGKEVLVNSGVDIDQKGKGGIEHRFWQHKIADYYKDQGYNARVEYSLEGKGIDVFVKNGEKIAIEVAMDAKGEVENIKQDLKLNIEQLTVACRNAEVMSEVGKKAREVLGKEKVSQIRFRGVGYYL